MHDGTHCAGQGYFAKENPVGRQSGACERGDERSGGGQIRRRLVDAQPPGDIEIYVMLPKPQPGMGLKHRQHGSEAGCIPTDDGAARRAQRRWRHQRLNFHQNRARAFHAGKDSGSGRGGVAARQKQRRGVRHFGKAEAGHFKNADFVGGAETVFNGAQNAELVAAFPFERNHGVDHVLDNARPGDLPVLGDMADKDDGGAAGFGVSNERLRAAAHLRHGARR